MRTEDLIDRLVADAEPVKPLLAPIRRAGVWTVVAIVCIGLGVLYFGLRGDEMNGWYRAGVGVRLALLTATMWLAVTAAFRLSVPGHDLRAWSRWWPLTVLGIVVALVTAEVLVGAATGDLGSPMRAWRCVRKVAFVGALPAILAIVLIQRAQAIEPRWAGLLGVLAAGAAGAVTSELACPVHAPLHVLLWHLLPVAASALLGVGLSVIFWRRRVDREARAAAPARS